MILERIAVNNVTKKKFKTHNNILQKYDISDVNFAINKIESSKFNCFRTLWIEGNNALNNQNVHFYDKKIKIKYYIQQESIWKIYNNDKN